MKNILLFSYVLIYSHIIHSQIVYSENFGIGCSTGNLATTFGWTNTITGTNQATANIWYVSAAERGMGVGICGAACGGTNSRTLHLSAAAAGGGDLGAAYLETDPTFCSFGFCAQTDKRIESPTINCIGVSNIPFTFEYIENGEGTNDNATVWYSANNGGSWALLDDMPKTVICGSGQGQWALRSLVLPASANNNPTVKIGFRWINNANGIGTDPSVAIDNIVIGTPLPLGVDMQSIYINCSGNQNELNWRTENEINSEHFNIHFSTDGMNWRKVTEVKATNDSQMESHYSWIDTANYNELVYYFIEQVDFNGESVRYPIQSSANCYNDNQIIVYPNPSNGKNITFYSSQSEIRQISILSIYGQEIMTITPLNPIKSIAINEKLSPGRYIGKVVLDSGIKNVAFIIN